MSASNPVDKAIIELDKYGLKYEKINYKGNPIGLSILDYFCDNPSKDIAYSLLVKNNETRKKILENLLTASGLLDFKSGISSYSYFWIDKFKTTHKKPEPITIIGAQGYEENEFLIFIHYGCAIIEKKFIDDYGLSGMEIIANATHAQDKETRKKRALLVFNYLKEYRFFKVNIFL